MDVATVATTAAAAGQLGKVALNASNGLLVLSKSVDEPVRNLQSEVKAFGDACKALQSLLNGFLRSQTRLTEAEDEHFFARLQRSMSEYESTVEPLDRRVRSVEKARSGLFGKNKLNLKSEEVVRLRQRTESHLLSIQLTLGILNLYVTFPEPITLPLVAEHDHRRTSLLDNIELSALRNSISETQRKRAKLQAISQVNSPHLGQDQKLYQKSAALIADKITRSYERRRQLADEYNRRLTNGDVSPGWRKAWWLLRGRAVERERAWREKGGKKRPSLTLALNDSVKYWFWSAGVLKVSSDIATILTPLLVKAIITFATESFE